MLEKTPQIPYENLPLGFRFKPTGEQLINHYLKRKLNGTINPSEMTIIPEINLSSLEPWDLMKMCRVNLLYEECFFFAWIDRKYKSGNRKNRATEKGYWKPTGKDRLIKSKGAVVGMKKTLVFHSGRKGKGEGTGWVIHEFRAVQDGNDKGLYQGEFVVCHLFKKEKGTHEDEMETNVINEEVTHLPNQVSPHIDNRLVPHPSSSKTANEILADDAQAYDLPSPSLLDTDKLQKSHITINITSDHKEDDMYEVLFVPETSIEPIEVLADKLIAESNSANTAADTLQHEKSHSNVNIAATDAAYNQVSGIHQMREESLFDGLKDFLGSDYHSSLIPDDNINDYINFNDQEPSEYSVAIPARLKSSFLCKQASAPINHDEDSIQNHKHVSIGWPLSRPSTKPRRIPFKLSLQSVSEQSNRYPEFPPSNPMVNAASSVSVPDSNNKDDPSDPFMENGLRLCMSNYATNVDVQSQTLVQDENTGGSVYKFRIFVAFLVFLSMLGVLIWLLKKYI